MPEQYDADSSAYLACHHVFVHACEGAVLCGRARSVRSLTYRRSQIDFERTSDAHRMLLVMTRRACIDKVAKSGYREILSGIRQLLLYDGVLQLICAGSKAAQSDPDETLAWSVA